MRILRVINTMNPSYGGPCQGIRNSIKGMAGLGITNEVVCLDDPEESFLQKDDFKIHAIGKAKGPWSFNKLLKPWLKENINQYDAVIVHGLWLYHSYAVTNIIGDLKKKAQHIPRVFIMPHGMLDPYFQKAKERLLKAIRNVIYWRLIENKVVKQASGVLFTCERELELAKVPFHPYQPQQQINVGYGVPEPPLYTQAMQFSFREKIKTNIDDGYLLYLSRIHEKKGTDLLITAYCKLLKEGFLLPDLVVAGPGMESDYGRKIRDLAGGNAQIHFPGMLTDDHKWGAIYGAQAFILPSHQENFGIAVVEAMSCGKPVLITDQVNICEEIRADDAGLINADDANGIYRLLYTWIHLDNDNKARIGQNAQRSFEKNFSVNNSAKQLLKAIS
jgi:glycosyltransferase involved in cell wall biosynthesis